MIEALQMLPFLHDLEQIRKPVFTFIAKTVTLLGQEVLPVLIICIIFWCIDKKAGYKFIFVFLQHLQQSDFSQPFEWLQIHALHSQSSRYKFTRQFKIQLQSIKSTKICVT